MDRPRQIHTLMPPSSRAPLFVGLQRATGFPLWCAVVLAFLLSTVAEGKEPTGRRPEPSIPTRLEQEKLVRAYLQRKMALDPNSISSTALPNAGAQTRTAYGFPYFPPEGFYSQTGTTAQIEAKLKDNLEEIVTDLHSPTGLLSKFYPDRSGKRIVEGEKRVSDRLPELTNAEVEALTNAELYALAAQALANADRLLTSNSGQLIAILAEVNNYESGTFDGAVDGALQAALDLLASYRPNPPAYSTYSYLAWYSGQFIAEHAAPPYQSRAYVSQAFVSYNNNGNLLGLTGLPSLYGKLGYYNGTDESIVPNDGAYHPISGVFQTRYGGTQGAWAGQIPLSNFKYLLDGFNEPPTLGPDDPDCQSGCKGQDCSPGSGNGALNSAHYYFSLGSSRFGDATGSIELNHDRPDREWYTPRGLLVSGGFGFRGIHKTITADLLQAVGPGVLVDVEVLTPSSYELRYYHWDGSGTPGTDGTYPVPAGSPHTVFLVDNPDGTGDTFNELRITRTAGTDVDVWIYSFDAGTGVWTMTSDNGNTVESYLESGDTDPSLQHVERTVSDGGDVVLSKTIHTYQEFEWGEELVSVVSDPDGAALTTTWTYYDDEENDGANYGKMRSVVDENGHWEIYTYDLYGRLVKTKTQHGGSAFDSADGSNRVTEIIYPSAAGPGIDYYTTIEKLLGTEIGRQYRRVKIDGYDEITCTVPGAGIEAATNLVRELRLHLGNEYAGMVKSERHHDGTLTLYEYTALDGLGNPDIDNGEMLTTVVEKGEPNGAGTDVVDGIRTTTVVDRRGNEIARTIVDIDSGLTIEQRLATEQDEFGRPTEVTLLDGRTETFDYDCCGLASQTDHLGITTSYDEVDGIEESETRLGVTVTTRREGRSTVVERSDGTTTINLGGETRDIAGRTVAMVGRGGRTTTISRAINGSGNRVVTYTLPNNSSRIEEILPDGRLLRVTGTGVNGQAFDYGIEAGQFYVKTTELDAAGDPTSEWTKSFADAAGRVWKIVRANGATWTTEFDAAGQVSRTVDPDGVATLYDYDGQGTLRYTAIDLDDNGEINLDGIDRVTRVTQSIENGPGAFPVVRTISEIWRTDEEAAATEVIRIEAEVTGNAAWMTTPGGTSHRSLAHGGPGAWTITTNLPDGGRIVEGYTAGRLASRVVSNGGATILEGKSFDYDGHGRLESSTDFRNGATTYTYHSTDEVDSVTTPAPGDGRPAQTTAYTYTSLGLVDTVTMPDAGVVDYGYTAKGLLETVTGVRVYEQLHTYTAQGRPATLVTNPGTVHAQTTSWTYHPQSGLVASKTFPGGNGIAYTHTLGGRLLTRTNGRSIVATYGYDDAGEVSGIDYSDSTPDVGYGYHRDGSLATVVRGAETRSFGYGSPGVLESETVDGGLLDGLSLTTGRDALDRRTSLTLAFAGETVVQGRTYQPGTSRVASVYEGTRSAAYSYHPNSNLLRSTTHKNDGTPRLFEERSYDNLGMLSSIASLGTGTTTPVRRSYGYTRNGINQVTGVTREDDFDWVYGYDSEGHLESASRKLPNNTALAGEQFAYDYDPLGNRVEATFGGGTGSTHTIGYTPKSGDLSQIDEIETPGIALVTGAAKTTATVLVDGTAPDDRQSERFAHPVAVDNSGGAVLATVPVTAEEGMDLDSTTVKKLVPEANIFYSYDADGNVTSDGFFAYVWDAENRLLSVETLSGVAPAGVTEVKVEYAYDYFGRRIQRKEYKKVSGSWSLDKEQLFVHDGYQIACEWNGTGDLVRTFLWGADLSGSPGGAGGAGGLVSLAEQGGMSSTAHFASYDGGGNLVALTDVADGETSSLYEYDPYGNLLASSGPMAEGNPFRFGTQWRDGATGLDLYHYRVYDSVQGRWLSRDPIGEAGGMNLYGFLGNAPVADADILGLTSLGLPPAVTQSEAYIYSESLRIAANQAALNFIKKHPQRLLTAVKHVLTFGYDAQTAAQNLARYIGGNLGEHGYTWLQDELYKHLSHILETLDRAGADPCYQKYLVDQMLKDLYQNSEAYSEVFAQAQVDTLLGAILLRAVIREDGIPISRPSQPGSPQWTSIKRGLNEADVLIDGEIARIEIGYIENLTGEMRSFIKDLKAYVRDSGAKVAVVETGHIINDDLLIKLGQASQSGEKVFGGSVEVITKPGVRPQFRITIPLE